MPICGVIWPPHPLGGVAGRRSLLSQRHPSSCPVSSTGRLVAAYYFKYASFVSFWASGFRLPARSRFGEGRGALHLRIFEQP